MFHAYFDVDVEELLAERKVYVCDKISEFVYRVLLPRVGLKDWSAKRQNDRLKSKLDEHITYQDVYKTLKRYDTTCCSAVAFNISFGLFGISPQRLDEIVFTFLFFREISIHTKLIALQTSAKRLKIRAVERVINILSSAGDINISYGRTFFQRFACRYD